MTNTYHTGDYVAGGEEGTEDYDQGYIQKIEDSRAFVGWDSGVAAWVQLGDLIVLRERALDSE